MTKAEWKESLKRIFGAVTSFKVEIPLKLRGYHIELTI